MADKKYIGTTIAITPRSRRDFDKVLNILSVQLGFKPSRADVVSYLIQFYIRHNSSTTELR